MCFRLKKEKKRCYKHKQDLVKASLPVEAKLA